MRRRCTTGPESGSLSSRSVRSTLNRRLKRCACISEFVVADTSRQFRNWLISSSNSSILFSSSGSLRKITLMPVWLYVPMRSKSENNFIEFCMMSFNPSKNASTCIKLTGQYILITINTLPTYHIVAFCGQTSAPLT